MNISKHPSQRLNNTYIQADISIKENKYILAIKDNTYNKYSDTKVNLNPILFINNDDYWGVDREEIKRINISPLLNKNFTDHELVIIGWPCKLNDNESTIWLYSHYTHANNVSGMTADEQRVYDVFCGQIDYSNCTVTFDNKLDELFKKYNETQNKFYIKDNSDIVGPFVIHSYNESANTYNIKKYDRLKIQKVGYDEQYIFSIENDEYTNFVDRYFLLEEEREVFFEKASDIDFISDLELFEWARLEYEKNVSQNRLQKDSISLLYQWIDRIPEIDKQKYRYKRLESIKDSLSSYEDSIAKFISIIPEIKTIKSEIDTIEAQLESKRGTLEGEISALEDSYEENSQKCGNLKSEIRELEERKEKFKTELEEKYIQEQQGLKKEIEDLKQERDSLAEDLVAKRKEQSETIDEEIKGLKMEAEFHRKQKIELEDAISKLQKDFSTEQSEANRILSELVKSKTHFDFIRGKRFSDIGDTLHYTYNYNKSCNQEFKTYEDLRNHIIMILRNQNRKCEEHFIDNLLISTTQNMLTLFVGLPGTGKTSMARILCSCISGEDRFTEVSVGRGWTSHKDLLGYFNPLSGSFIESHKGLHRKLQDLDYEYNNDLSNNTPISYILLDEANLSPIEHYWSMFINDTDRNYDNTFEIDLGAGGLIQHKNAIRFIGTLNNDHTTEKISPRILDRSNVIYFRPEDIDKFIAPQILEELYIPKGLMEQFCCANTSANSDYTLEAKIISQKELFKTIKDHLRNSMNIYLSPRIDIAMEKYCVVANRTMTEKFRPLDYFIAQRVLPLINNSKKEHLVVLKEKLSEFNLSKSISVNIIDQIIKQGEDNFDMYDYFSIIG